MVVAWYAVIGLALNGAELAGGMRKLALGLFTLFAVFPLATPFPYFFFDPIAVPTKKIIGIALDAGTGVAANWFPIGSSINASVNTLPGIQQVVDVNGRIIVAPGRVFALHTLAAAVTTSAQFYIWFSLKRLPLGATLR